MPDNIINLPPPTRKRAKSPKARKNTRLMERDYEAFPKGSLGIPGSGVTDDLVWDICSLLAQGQTLGRILRGDGMPLRCTFVRWIMMNSTAYTLYNISREIGCDAIADDCLDIADGIDPQPFVYAEDGTIRLGFDGQPLRPHVDPLVTRMRIDARRWYLSKIYPRRFGDKVTNELTGPDGQPLPLPSPHFNVVFPDIPMIIDQETVIDNAAGDAASTE